MCGLSGFISTNILSAQQQAYLETSLSTTLLERGPDNLGFYRQKNLIFCHTRLAIQGMNSEFANQPFETSRFVLLFNGEIYNHFELRKAYLRDHQFRSSSDTETLASLVENYDLEFVLSKLNGIFALALFCKDTNNFFLARDHLGIKPLYYCIDNIHEEKILAFASYSSTVAHSLRKFRKLKLSKEGLINYFMLGAPFGESTLFENIYSVEPSSLYQINLNSWVVSRRHYKPETNDTIDLDYIAKLEKTAECDSAILLSGGVDSSALATILKPKYSIHLDSSEKQYAKHVAERINSKFRLVNQSNADFAGIYTQYSRTTGHCSASAPIPFLAAQSMQETGIRVVFSANGADELFYGYPRTPIYPVQGDEDQYFWGFNRSGKPALNTSHEAQIHHIFRDFANLKPIILGSEVLNKPPTYQSLSIPTDSKGWHYRQYELSTYVSWDLNITLDHAFMLFGIEARVPFLNPLMIDYAKQMSWTEHISDVYGRKKILKGLLMEKNISNSAWDRPKLGFSLSDKLLIERRKKTNSIQKELSDIISVDLDFSTRDGIYLESALHAFYYWKQVWIDTGIVSIL